MKIIAAQSIRLSIPFSDGGRGIGMTPSAWNKLDMVLVRLETDTGLVGWGEAFSYFCAGAVKAMLDETILPLVIGQDVKDPSAFSVSLQQRLCLFGRYGITLFGLSGVDIALWDLVAKERGQSLSAVLATPQRDQLDAYASLVRYGDAKAAALHTQKAVSEGYRFIKLHEITRSEIAACHAVLNGADLMIDVNCTWSEDEARSMAAWLKTLDTLWLEEPTFPPEDYQQMQRIGHGMALAGGENLSTVWQFQTAFESGCLIYPQPSVTKVGGVSEMMKIAALATTYPETTLQPHSPYFGPGYLATLQVCAVLQKAPIFEFLYIWPDAYLYPNMPLPEKGRITIPDGPGLGMDPDAALIDRFRIA